MIMMLMLMVIMMIIIGQRKLKAVFKAHSIPLIEPICIACCNSE